MESKDFHTSNAFAAELEQRMGVSYVAVVRRAGQLRKTLTVDTAGFDTLLVSHVEGRYRAVLMLEGMVMALTEILKATPHDMKHWPAEDTATADVVRMSSAVADDVENYWSHTARASKQTTAAPPEH